MAIIIESMTCRDDVHVPGQGSSLHRYIRAEYGKLRLRRCQGGVELQQLGQPDGEPMRLVIVPDGNILDIVGVDDAVPVTKGGK